MKKAFTLVELLVVIGILGILIGVLVASMSGGTDSALAARCLTNMKNLATACQTFGMATGRYPRAGSYEQMGFDESQGIQNVKRSYYEVRGWVSWDSRDAYGKADKKGPQSHKASPGWFTSTYNQEYETREYALTNGALWKYVSGTREVFVCPLHRKKYQGRRDPVWSYVMNSYFGWDKSKGVRPMDSGYNGIEYGTLAHADKRLLFAEIPFTDVIDTPDEGEGPGTRNDCTLQYEAKDGGEYIGFNHGKGKRDRYAHVVFADGHTEKIICPRQGISVSDAKELTELLCQGKDVAFNGTRYEELK